MERDVVCGMDVDPAKAAATSVHNGKTYYFCAQVLRTSSTPTRRNTSSRWRNRYKRTFSILSAA